MKKSVVTLLFALLTLLPVFGSEAIAPREISVKSTAAFLEAIAPHTTIHIHMNEIDPIIFSGFEAGDVNQYCRFEYAYDGVQLVIHDVEGLSIIGPEEIRARILTPYSYANVIYFDKCKDLSLQWLNCGHDIEGYCTGGVLAFNECQDVEIKNCDLWGCGIEGLSIYNSSGFDVSYTTIRDCSYSIMSIFESSDLSFSYCLMHDNREFDLLIFNNSKRVSFENCVIWNNNAAGGLYANNLINCVGSAVSFTQCAIFNNSVQNLSNEGAVIDFQNCIVFGNQYRGWDY